MTREIGRKESLAPIGFGMLFLLCGGWLLLAAFDVIPVDKRGLNVPQWVLAAFALTFLLPGLFFVSGGFWSLVTGRAPTPATVRAGGAAVLACMALTVLGAAFLGKAEGFSGALGVFGVRIMSRGGDVAVQRGLFALLGLVTAVIAGVVGWGSVAALREQRRTAVEPPDAADTRTPPRGRNG